MSVCRKLPDGTVQKIAGHTILLDANASEVRQGTFSIMGTAGTSTSVAVTFSDPMPDTDYVVIYEYQTWGGYPVNTEPSPVTCTAKTTTGFTASMWCFAAMSSPMQIKYTAYKPVKIEGYTELQNKVNNPDDTPTEDSVNLCTSGGIYEAIKNASAVWKGTKSEWTALPATDKKSYDLAVLVDAKLIKAVDRTDGSDTDVADLGQIWKGTRTEWEALSLAERKTHGVAFFTDKRYAVSVDPTTGDESNLVDWTGVWKGSMEDWEALTDAEKAEWDVCITPTITPQDTNPFRTLSDPETLTIAPNTDYTCPHDGFITIESNGADAITVNGIRIGRNNSGDSVTIPVQKGDVVRCAGGSTPGCVARWYTNEVSPGEPDTPVLYRSQSLDWDNLVNVPVTEFSTGYSAPFDGFMLIRYGATNSFIVLVNGKNIFSIGTEGGYVGNVSFPVSKDDVVSFSGSTNVTEVLLVPYKDYPDYSTTEHWTGRRWIDGKKIYSKVVQLPSSVDVPTSWGNIPSMPSDIDVLLSFSALRKDSGSTGIKATLDVSRSGSGPFIWMTTHNNMGVNVLVIEYTKVND